ncbi:MAG TPA: tetratricopeptide repeat protein, partial [Ignavibacteriaceae bacterium]
DSVKYLISEYQNFKNTYPDHSNTYEATLNQALLYAYYLDQKDSAVNELNRLIDNNKVTPTLKAKSKIELGDIYLLKEEPWEATLLYSQVEKTQRETPLGYEAKLRNAKLSYFKGEFLLAQEHLDILKQATSREIANDAMELSMRIKENTAYDTTGASLKEYAAIELLLAQNKNDIALERLNNFRTNDQVQTSIKDDVYWLEANLRMKRGEFDQSIALLEKILTEFGDDILADDAYFLEGEIYELQIKNKDKAMEIYREFLNKYPGSVYAAEARKRYRMLRGDFSEVDTTPKF